MSCRVDSTLIAGACIVGNRGLGELGATIRANTATGTHGPGYLYNDLTGADDAKEVRGLIVTPPAAGTFAAEEDGSFTLTGAPDGAYSFVYRLFADGADLGTATATVTIGTPSYVSSGGAGAVVTITSGGDGTAIGEPDPAAAVWAYVLSNGQTAGQTLVQNNEMLRIVMAALAGTTAGIGTDTETYFGEDGTTPRIVATFDGQGNRVTVLTDGSP